MTSLRYRVESLVLTCDHINADTQELANKKGIKVYAFKEIEVCIDGSLSFGVMSGLLLQKLGIVDLQTFRVSFG